ncbi:MAG: exodeoxyribonuclease V subunit alpha [Sodalis sp. (in: enterobacteria)]
MENIIFEAQRLGLWRPLDVYFARMVANENQPALMLASICLSRDVGSGHVCLPLELLTPEQLFEGRLASLAKKAWLRAGSLSLDGWQQVLLASNAVSDGSRPTPLVLDRRRLYLHRMWQHECVVAQFFNCAHPPVDGDEDKIRALLTRYFPSDGGVLIDWQKIAVAVAITHPVALISGGPGTGKTSTVVKLLAILLQLQGGNLRFMMAAPTGKAASRLSESIGLALKRLGLDEEQKHQFPCEAITLHRLLGAQLNSQRMRYNRENPLHLDILIIDEASMIDLSMMSNVIAALPPKARVIFLGDPYQLSAVEAGSVLGDICEFADNAGYSSARRAELERLTGYMLPSGGACKNGSGIADNFCLLLRSYRFDEGSGIEQLSNAIKSGDDNEALRMLHHPASMAAMNLSYTSMRDALAYQHMLDDCVEGYREYLQRVHNHDSPSAIIDAFNRFRLLCALREGQFGVTGLNIRIELALSKAGLITKNNIGCDYVGRPVMIIRNSRSLGLYNGDIGILLRDGEEKCRVYFSLPMTASIKSVPLSCLPEHETCFAMTVHKSQGSEFTHTALLLPNQILPVLTRSWVYTAVTRSRVRLSLYATDEILRYAITTKTQRRSGFIDRLVTGYQEGCYPTVSTGSNLDVPLTRVSSF